MKFNPKEDWNSVYVLTGGATSNHASPTIMRMRPLNGELARTDAKNASVFGPQRDRVFNNNIPIYWPVIYNIKQRDVVEELDTPISWGEIKKPTTKLANEKVSVLNCVPTNTFKALNDENPTWIMLLYNQLFHSQYEFDKWHE